ncbi:LysR family transcriptional regulator [Donghicola tyrosinivorans]|uniref:LysR family transcriptional regulator for metE and metH n=1 Tax=Donghicola tyrosinivorans TaxID=1652492 RepID=A0A2T0WC84_9RHOB|nr:LysR family transcriptional regulator [Donghicola tyrosinivorans]PRY84308.1 LysR family transcriptional regulator for metE and metH [Donghicola tyrosinivorans]
MLDRQHLTILRSVARYGSVTAAAGAMNLSQSAISHAIAKLEDRHRVKLWRRKGRRLEMTQAGRYLLELAERIVPELEHAETVLADMAKGRRGSLRIGMECHPCEQWLMHVVGPFLQAWPAVDLQMKTAFRFDGIAALQAHEIDMLVTPDPMALKDVTFTPVFDYELVIVLPADHPLAGRDCIQPDDLQDQTLYTVPVTPDRLDIFTRFLTPAGRRPAAHVGIESVDLMLQLVAAGRGVTVLPDWLVALQAEHLPIVTRPIGAGLQKAINLGVRAEDHDIDYVDAFRQIASGVVPE